MFLGKNLKGLFSRTSPLMTNLLNKVPKEVEIDVSPGFMSIFF